MVKSTTLRRSKPSVESSSENNMTDGLLSDDLLSSDSETESNSSSDSNQTSDSKTWTALSATIRVLSDSLLRTGFAEMEMIKAREAARWKAEKRRLETEVELTRMVMQTHLQATTSLFVGEQSNSPSRRKRKRSAVEEHESSTTREKSLASLGLLQLNLIWNSLT